jgi:hypothetical protein
MPPIILNITTNHLNKKKCQSGASKIPIRENIVYGMPNIKALSFHELLLIFSENAPAKKAKTEELIKVMIIPKVIVKHTAMPNAMLPIKRIIFFILLSAYSITRIIPHKCTAVQSCIT